MIDRMKVALLANWMAALMRYLKEKNRWQVKKIEVETDEMSYTKGTGTYNSGWFADTGRTNYFKWILNATKDRDDVLTQTLAHFGIAVEIPKVATQHDRELTVTFNDGYELQVDLGQGLSHWSAVNGGEESVFSFKYGTGTEAIENEVKQLIDCKVRAGGENRTTYGFVEWRKARTP